MPRVFIHMSFFLFMVTAISGLWMRFSSIYPSNMIPYTNMLHAHSHTAILGWALLGVFTVFLALFWTRLRRKKQAVILFCTLFIVTLFMFFPFLDQGYDVFSLVMSTLLIFIVY